MHLKPCKAQSMSVALCVPELHTERRVRLTDFAEELTAVKLAGSSLGR